MRTEGFGLLVAVAAVIVAALMAAPIGSMQGMFGSSEHAPVADVGTQVLDVSPRSVDYRYYDFFDVPFGEWWDSRWDIYHTEQIISYTYPTMFYLYDQPPGKIWTYSNMMLDVKGRNMSEINMNSHPEFLPFLGTARGGNATIDWFMQYLTKAEMARYPGATAAWYDGWVISLNGTTTMDKQAAMTILNVTSAGYDNFANWWTANERGVEDAYVAWLMNEGNKRLDIYNMYEYPLTPLTFNLGAQKVADKIVLTYDIVSWGMEAMMTRWLHEAFMPTEHYFEGFNLHASIGPERTDVDIATEVAYGIYAHETAIVPGGKTHGDPCWVWRTNHQDVIRPTIGHPKSDIAPYMNFTYDHTAPGSLWYGRQMPYDYAPTAHNLSANETLVIEFPTGPQLFKEQAFYPNGTPILDKPINERILNTTANMTLNYAAPMVSDNPELSPGYVTVDNIAGRLTYTGPIDMWTWSKDQAKHSVLASEWDRLGIIPYSIPYVELTRDLTPQLPCAYGYAVSAMSSPVVTGELVTFTVTVYDQYGNVFPGYDGTLSFASTDVAAVLPGDYTFATADAGVHIFSNLIFRTAGLQDLMLVDAANPVITGGAWGIDVKAAPVADCFEFAGIPSIVGVNTAQDVTVTVYDQYGQLFVGYTGTITFGSNRSADVMLPPDTTVPAGENHVTVHGGMTFTSTGWFLVSASDSIDDTIYGETAVRVELDTPHVDHFVITGETELLPGVYHDLTVEAVDQFGSTFQTYTGTVHFATDAPGGTYSLPQDTAFAPADNGVKVFTHAMRFSQMGTYQVNVSDTVAKTAYGLLTGINVATMPNIVYTAYDFFQEPWGEWFWNPNWRHEWYYQDYILSNTTGQYSMLYDPDQNGARGVIYAPYRFNMTATNVSTVDVHNPEFMPVLGGVGPQVGAEAEMHIRMQYLDHAWWNSYWYPTWGGGSSVIRNYINTNDGYLIGTIIDVELNREAAYEWMGMPTTADPATWWGTNQYPYEDAWSNWIDNEGNNRLDIYCGYEDYYYPEWTWSDMSVDADGDILLTVAHISWGYEVLMTRWLNEAQLCTHEPWFEDFDLQATLGDGIARVSFDAAVQYGFHAVKANASASNDGAWAWEPAGIDYWPSWAQAPAYHHSEYDPYAGPSWGWGAKTTYQSWNAGDPRFGSEVEYTATPHRFNLYEFQTLVVKLPQGSNVPGYLGQGAGANAIFNMSLGDTHDYDALRYTGTASLGYVITNPTNPLDMASVYDPATKTLTFTGPYDFDNPGGRTGGMLYHGAPWIEFNVDANSPPSYTHIVTKGAQGPRASAVTWEYVPTDYMMWTGHIVNDGLRSLVVDVYDITTGVPVEIMHQRVRFASYDAYPTGIVDTAGVIMSPTHRYSITVTPNGPRGSSCTVDDPFRIPPPPPVAVFTAYANNLTVFVDGSSSYDLDGFIVSYDWDFGDGTSAAGVTANHTYATRGTYTITLTVMNNFGLNGSASEQVTIVTPPPIWASFTYSVNGLTVNVDASASSSGNGIASYDWDWGDGTTGSGMVGTHTYPASVNSTPSEPYHPTPGPPHAIFGFTYAADGVTVLTGCNVTLVNLRTGYSLTNTSDAVYGAYVVDAYAFDTGWFFGDLIRVAATSGAQTGWTISPLTDSLSGYDQIDVAMGFGVATITLRVTDTNGQTASVSHTVKLVLPPIASFTLTVDGLTVNVDASASSGQGGIVSYSWDWGDGTTGTGVTATHTYSTARSVLSDSGHALSGRGRMPMPYTVFGYTYGPDGVTPLNGCTVTITNTRTGESMIWNETRQYWDPNLNIYSLDLLELPTLYMIGDMLIVTATNGTFVGSVQAPVTDNPNGYLRIDVVLSETVEPIVKTITLTVTDSLGRTASVSQQIVLYP
ncbi:MAG: PKD domain-containing protein [Candidatus Thermoplasmatota archaeon]|nr:PKD domain-containing protein [Candidatus Thermoplasmatota archaeon]